MCDQRLATREERLRDASGRLREVEQLWTAEQVAWEERERDLLAALERQGAREEPAGGLGVI